MHNIYSYHAKFNPLVPEYFMNKYFKKDMRILDPFCGSGTTLRVALEKDINSVGIDLSPIAILNSKVKINNYSYEEIEKYFIDIISNDEILYDPKFPNKEIWFSSENLKEMSQVYSAILQVDKESYRDLFKLCFLSLLNKISRRRKTWNLGYIADNVMPNMESKYTLKKEFIKKIQSLQNKQDLSINSAASSEVHNMNLLDYETMGEFDGVITSPPYPFAVDFIKYHRLPLYWLNSDVEKLSKKEVGARNKRSRKTSIDDFYNDMKIIYQKIMNDVKADGYWCMTIGNTTRQRQKIEFKEWSIELFEKNGWTLIEDTERCLKKQTMGQKRIPTENMLVFKKIKY